MLVRDLQPMLHLHAHVLDEHVGRLHQTQEGRVRSRILEIKRDAALAAMQVDEVEPVARSAEAFVRTRRLHANDVRAPVGKVAHARGPGACEREVENAEAGQRERIDGWDRHAREATTVNTPRCLSPRLRLL